MLALPRRHTEPDSSTQACREGASKRSRPQRSILTLPAFSPRSNLVSEACSSRSKPGMDSTTAEAASAGQDVRHLHPNRVRADLLLSLQAVHCNNLSNSLSLL